MKYLFIFFLCAMFYPLEGQLDISYQKPNQEILELADASLPPILSLNDEATMGLLRYRSNFKTIDELSEEEMRLAGLRINPKTYISSRERYYHKLEIFDIESGKNNTIAGLPENGRFSNFKWSKDDKKIAFLNTEINGVSLWVMDIDNKSAKKITDAQVNACMRNSFMWIDKGNALLVKMRPSDRATLIDADEAIPTGPTVSVNDGKKAQNRTYQDLLKNKTDEANFETLVTSEIWKYNLDGTKSKWKDAGMYSYMSSSPDENYLLVNQIQKPFSYLVPYYRFPIDIDIYKMDGSLVHHFLSVPLVEDLPKGFMAVRQGPRNISWRTDQGSTLFWAEALDEGDPENEVENRDAIFQVEAPFNSEKTLLLNTINRYRYMQWGNSDLAICHDYWWTDRNTKSYVFNPKDAKQEPVPIFDRNMQDRYNDPGSFVTAKNEYGLNVVEVKDNKAMLMGDGYSDDGVFPFMDQMDLQSGEKTRLYHADDKDKLEYLITAIDSEKGDVLVSMQSKTEYPNYYIRNIKDGKLKRVSSFDNPFKSIEEVEKEIITYKRDDGVELSATLYLPNGYDKAKKEKLPMIMWAYPREFKDSDSAGQITSSPNEFTYPWYGSPIFWVNRGYVVLDDASFPIIGEGEEEPNDSFIKQLVGNAKAAIDAVDNMGYIDRNRVGVGGHSYGAFMTANLLSHSNLFAAGIARSGAYNRTLTPFGFQAEERNYWEAPEIYYNMSPFMHADKMKTPLLLIHGQEDNNSGTYPMQSERYFNALKGLGATVRLVMLPKESHGYSAKESVLHMLWEQDEWLEKYVKNRNNKTVQQP